MRLCLTNPLRFKLAAFFKLFIGTLLLFGLDASCFADVVLHGNQVITTPTVYNNVTLDLTDGRFTINQGGSLKITNSTINIQISSSNPFLIKLMQGGLDLENNKVNVRVTGLPQTPNSQAAYQLMNVVQGSLMLQKNLFVIGTPFTVGFLTTQGAPTYNFMIKENSINNFHGGISLINSADAEVSFNKFANVSLANLFNNAKGSHIDSNLFLFPGNLHLGNAIDILNSECIKVTNNIISSGSNFGITVTGGDDILIENNKITDGKDFAIIINTPSLAAMNKNKYLLQFMPQKKIKFLENNNITVSNNYIEQNKFGLTGGLIDSLRVEDNIFIQRFNDPTSRQYWTNNDNLLPNVQHLTWNNNEYKEAFTQDNQGDNSMTLQFVSFPKQGGVVL